MLDTQQSMKGQEEYVQGIIRQYQERLDYIRSNSILAPAYLRRKILFWILRTGIAALVYLIFWKFSWVRWTLVITVPISILNITSVFTWKYLLREKLRRNEQELAELENTLRNNPEEVHQ